MTKIKSIVLGAMLSASLLAVATPEQQSVDLERFTQLTSQLRCVVCQNESLNDSTASLAVDLKKQVWVMMQQGKTNQEIIDYLTQRYGEFVLFKPSFSPKNYILWLGPLLVLIITLLWFLKALYQRKKSQQLTLSADEKANLERLLK